MRNIIKIWPVILIALLLLNMPSIKGLTNVQLDRPIQFQIPEIGELTVIGMDGGAIELPQQGQPFGELINNSNFDLELYIKVEVEFLEARYNANHVRWIPIRFNMAEGGRLDCGNMKYGDPSSSAGDFFTLAHGEALNISLDQSSDFIPRGGGPNPTLNYALGVARFYITGYDPDGNEIFYLEPAGDYLTQYFYKGDPNAESTVFNSEAYEEIDHTIDLQEAIIDASYLSVRFGPNLDLDELTPAREPEDFEPLPDEDEVYENTGMPDEENNSNPDAGPFLKPLYPAAELDKFNLIGEIEDLQYMPENIKAYEYWYEAVDHSMNTSIRIIITQPESKLVGNQVIQILARRTDNSQNAPELNIGLYQDGVLIAALAEQEEIYCLEGTVLTYSFDASILEGFAGSSLEILMAGSDPGQQEPASNAVEFGAVVWLAQTE